MKIETVDEYISAQRDEIRPLLERLRGVILENAPNCAERMSWQMPTFWQKENLIHFAAHKNHIGIYPGGDAVGVFAEQLKEYATSKGTIQIPYSKPFPFELIAEITRWRVKCVEQ